MRDISASLDLSPKDLDLESIFARYIGIEQKICDSAHLHAIETIGEMGTRAGDQVTIHGRVYLLRSDVFQARRTFAFRIALASNPVAALRSTTKTIHAAGSIRRITVECPADFKHEASIVLGALEDKFTTQYGVLEASFLEGLKVLEAGIFTGLEPIMAGGFRSEHLDKLMNCVHLTVTPLKTNRYRFHVDHERAAFALSKFKLTSNLPFSALEGLITLLFDEGFDSFIEEGILTNTQFSTLPFDKIFEIEGYRKLSGTQNALYGFDALAVIEVCLAKDLSVQLNCPARFSAEVYRVVERIKLDMQDQFEANVCRLSNKRAQLAASQVRTTWNKHDMLQRMFALLPDIAVKYANEVTKTLLGLQ